jgi:DNA mismatch repair protein MutS
MLDYVKSNARTALKYKYFKPEIVENAETSFIDVKNARHPIIEQLISTEYIPNDIALGWSSTLSSTLSNLPSNNVKSGTLGMLLFGVNSSGKSSIGKAIALIIIMAQAGMFVPGQLRYKPYNKIITRLSGNDDIFKGHSSFVVEMTELRTILRNADASTLSLLDEISRGTEGISSASIAIATIQSLIEKKSSFIISTHMHHIPSFHLIKEIDNSRLRICHLTAIYDEILKELIFSRKLKEGSGSSIYGLEVCKSLDLDKNFLERANNIRREMADVQPLILSDKKSKYNTLVKVDLCSICGTNVNLQSHHIKEQHTADDNNFIDHFHKNKEFNILVLCQKCHTNIHEKGLSLNSKQTLNGTVYEIM